MTKTCKSRMQNDKAHCTGVSQKPNKPSTLEKRSYGTPIYLNAFSDSL